MKFPVLFGAAAICATALLAQIPGPATSTAASPAAGAPQSAQAQTPGQADPCAKEITIYIDLSGTMTKADPNQSNPDRVPLNYIAETLGRFASNRDFVREGDTVSIKFFGTIVQTQAEGREEVVAMLARLANPAAWRAVITGVRESDFKRYTNFDKAFSDVRDRVNNSGSTRQIVFVASDFVQDQLNQSNVDNVIARIAAFRLALATVRPLLASANTASRVQLVGIYAPDAPSTFDRAVALQVRADLEAAGMRLYQYNEDASEAARTLRNFFVGTVTAAPSDTGGVRVGGDNAVGISLRNPNCDPVEVVGLEFRGTTATQAVDISPVSVVNGALETRVNVGALAAVWNHDVKVTPLLRAGSTARTEPSPQFWLGDWVRISQLSPYAYPFANRQTGSTLVSALVNRSVRANGAISVTGIEPGGRARSFPITRGQDEQTVTFAFQLTPAQLQRLSAPDVVARIEGNGLRIIADSGEATVTVELPVAVVVRSYTGDVVVWAQIAAIILIVLLFAIVAIQAFFSRADSTTSDQVVTFLRNESRLVLPSLAAWGLKPPLGFSFVDGFLPVWAVVIIRALFVAYTGWSLMRTSLVVGGWKALFEPRFLPNNVAVFRRRLANTLIWVVTIGLFAGVLWTFFVQPPSVPEAFSKVLTGVLR